MALRDLFCLNPIWLQIKEPETEEMAIFTVFQLLFEALLTLNPFFIHFFPDIEKEYN